MIQRRCEPTLAECSEQIDIHGYSRAFSEQIDMRISVFWSTLALLLTPEVVEDCGGGGYSTPSR